MDAYPDRAPARDGGAFQAEDAVGRRLRHLNIVPQPPAALMGAPGESRPGRPCELQVPRWGLLGLHIAEATDPGALS